jgi:murein DD-endopeptidase MepM/ murein hydrolase activator NlpD
MRLKKKSFLSIIHHRGSWVVMTMPIHRTSLALALGFALLDATVLCAIVSCGGSPESPNTPSGPSCLDRAIFGDSAQSLYVLPYPVGTEYLVLQSYCTPGGSHSNQLAYDFEMPIGTPVTAARGGVVVYVVDTYLDADRDTSHFNYIFIQHDDGTVAFYAHFQLHSIVVRQNDRVETGQFIANSGSSGTPVADLHFGVYQSWPVRDGYDLPVNFRNAQGPLDQRGGLQRGITYLALPYR